MATQEELIEQYNRASAELAEHEAGVERAKTARKEIAQQLFELNGKGHTYDLGDGVPMIIVASKSKTYFFTPKEKWRKGGRPKKPAVKKKIVGMKVVEEPEQGRVIQAEATLTATGKAGVVPVPESAAVKTDPPASEPPERASEPEPVVEDKPEQPAVEPASEEDDVDALAAALAALE
jgi:hypothetical protein